MSFWKGWRGERSAEENMESQRSDDLSEEHPGFSSWQEGLRNWQENLAKRRDELDEQKARQDARVLEIREMHGAYEDQKAARNAELRELEREIDFLVERKRRLQNELSLCDDTQHVSGPKKWTFECHRYIKDIGWDSSNQYVVEVDEEGEISSYYEKSEFNDPPDPADA